MSQSENIKNPVFLLPTDEENVTIFVFNLERGE